MLTKVSIGLAGLLSKDRRSELFKNFAPHCVTHPSLLLPILEPSVGATGLCWKGIFRLGVNAR